MVITSTFKLFDNTFALSFKWLMCLPVTELRANKKPYVHLLVRYCKRNLNNDTLFKRKLITAWNLSYSPFCIIQYYLKKIKYELFFFMLKRAVGESSSVGKAAASKQRSAVRIQSLANFLKEHLFTYCQLYWKDENKRKRGLDWPFVKLFSVFEYLKKPYLRSNMIWTYFEKSFFLFQFHWNFALQRQTLEDCTVHWL